MHLRTPGRAGLLTVVVAAALAVTGCGGGSGGGGGAEGGSLAAVNLDGASFTVGSKEFTEQLVLGQIAIQALEAAGADVEDRTGIVGTTNVRQALLAGEIDMYWEYTGTGWVNNLGHTSADAPKDPVQLYQQVAAEDLRRNQVRWLDMAPLNNSYAIATAQGRDAELGVRSLSDYANLVNTRPELATMCVATEFLRRDDGWPGLQRAYGFTLPANLLQEVELGIIYTQVPSGQRCNFGEVTTTDGRVAAQNMVILEDDRNFFVPYNAAMTVRDDVFTQYPQLAEVFNPISAKLTSEAVRDMNEQVDVNGMLPAQVAETFLVENGFIGD